MDRLVVSVGATVIVDNATEMTIQQLVRQSSKNQTEHSGTHYGKDDNYNDLSQVGKLHNRYLDIFRKCLDDNPELLNVKLLQKKQSMIISNYYDLPFDKLLREETSGLALDPHDQEIVMGTVDRVFGRLARLSGTERNWANVDRSLFTESQKRFLKSLSSTICDARSVGEVEEQVGRLTSQLAGSDADREEIIPLYCAANVAVASFAYWSDQNKRESWLKTVQKMFPKLNLSQTPTVAADTTDADAIGAGLGAIGTCLGCGYVSGGAACLPCAGKGAAAGGVAVSFIWAVGSNLW